MMTTMQPFPIPLPKVGIAKRELHIFWMADCSGSMHGSRIATLNHAIREAIPAVRSAVALHPEAEVSMRAIKFSDKAEWHVGPDAVSLDEFSWPELHAQGLTATGQAIDLLAGALAPEKMPPRGYPPICVLITDGFSTDSPKEYERALERLLSEPWGSRAVRLVIAISEDARQYEEQLLKFVSDQEVGVLNADTPEKLVSYIQWATVEVSRGVTDGRSLAGARVGQNVHIPKPVPLPPVTVGEHALVW